VVDPAGQSPSPYLYADNNPVLYVDKDGKLFFVPILVGAAIGAAVSGVTYSVIAGERWTWQGFSRALGMGALGGALSGGIGAFGAGLGTNMAFGVLGNTAGYAATTAVFGGDLTWQGLVGATAGGLIAGSISGFQGVKGGAFKNIGAEILHSAGRGSIGGGVGGVVTNILSGKNPIEGFIRGAKYRAISGAVYAGLQIAAFGYAIQPDQEENARAIEALNRMENEMRLVGIGMGKYKPVYRSGGIWSMFTDRGIALGRNLVIPKSRLFGIRTDYTFIHETVHYYQQLYSGYASFLGRGMWEQWVLQGILGQKVYTTPGYQEWIANQLFNLYY